MGELESRTFPTQLEARDNGALVFRVTGYASTTGVAYDMVPTPSTSLGNVPQLGHRAPCRRGAAGQPRGAALGAHHDPPGRTGHLILEEDDHGLLFVANLDRSDPDSVSLMHKISSGLMDQCSFGFRVVSEDWNSDRKERIITEVDLER